MMVEATGSNGTIQLTDDHLCIIRSKKKQQIVAYAAIAAIHFGHHYLQIICKDEHPPQPGYLGASSHDSSVLFLTGQKAAFTILYQHLQSRLPWALFEDARVAGSPLAHDSRNTLWGCLVFLLLVGGLIWGISGVYKTARRNALVHDAKPAIAHPLTSAPTLPSQPGTVTLNAESGKVTHPTPQRVPQPRAVTEADLLALTDKTLHACNRSGVKRAQWARIKSSAYGPVFDMHFAADDNFSHAAIRDIVALRAFDLLKAMRDTVDLNTVARINISATFSLTDRYGNTTEDDIMRLEFSRSTLRQLNWEHIDVSNQVFRAADRVWIAPCVAN
jgi:hypothetical protein